MKRKQAERKRVRLEGLARCVTEFFPDLSDTFVCPTCLARISISDPTQISDAHILPQAMGGRDTTFLCRACNSKFGAAQDKWFGEHLRLATQAGATPLHTRYQEGRLEFDGLTVNGTYEVTKDGEIEFLVPETRNAPTTIAKLKQTADAARSAGRLTVSVRVPILAQDRQIGAGFITAAYLMWFRELGYSWALQHHLRQVREQIADPNTQVLPVGAIVGTSHTFDRPIIGVGDLAGEFVLLAGIAQQLVLLPPADRPDFYARLPSTVAGMRIEMRGPLPFDWQRLGFPGPVIVAFGERLAVVPDVLTRRRPTQVIFFPPDGSASQILVPISQEASEEQLQRPGAVLLRTRMPSVPVDSEKPPTTGQSAKQD